MNVHDRLPDCVPDSWEELLGNIANLNECRQDRDGEGALPARPELMEAAIQYLQSIRLSMSAPQDAYLAPDGTILIEWHLADGCATIANIREKLPKAKVLDPVPLKTYQV